MQPMQGDELLLSSPDIEGYRILEELDRGGMGAVYRAQEITSGRIVAIKVLLRCSLAGSAARRRFRRELRLAARLDHPNIVRVLGGGSSGGRPYLVMELVEGTRLDCYLAYERPEPAAAIALLAKVCDAVDHAHRHNVVHRDLKPSNIIIDRYGEPHLLDFGLAKAVDRPAGDSTSTRISLTGQIVGTLAYLSPEQAMGEPRLIDRRSDVFALGVMLYKALTGALPFVTDGQANEVIFRIARHRPRPPSAVVPGLDPGLETILLTALEKRREDRYQSAAELAADLRRSLRGEPIRVHSARQVSRRLTRLLSARFSLASLITLVALAGVVLCLGLYERHQAQLAARETALSYLRTIERTGSIEAELVNDLAAAWPGLTEPLLVRIHAAVRADIQVAISDSEQLLRDDARRWPCRELLAALYQACGKSLEAEWLREENNGKISDSAEHWYLRSLTTLDPELALYRVLQAIRRDRGHLLAWERYASLRINSGQINEALPAVDRVLALAGPQPSWLRDRVELLLRLGRLSDAAAALAHWQRIEPGNLDQRRYRASILLWQGKLQAALTELDIADPWAGQVLRCLSGELTPAELVAAADPGSNAQQCQARYYAAERCLLTGCDDQARRWLEQAAAGPSFADDPAGPLRPLPEHLLARRRLDSLTTSATLPPAGTAPAR